MRINRYLASCGLGSRRGVEKFVTEGRVVINGEVCPSLGTQVSEKDEIRVDGRIVQASSHCTLAFHKPRGLITSRSDEKGRTTVYDKLPSRFRPLAHVGRLDLDSEGLLILTNDGELAHRLTKPSSEIDKEYIVTVDQAFEPEHKTELLNGVKIEGGLARAAQVEIVSPRRLRIVLHQGLKRQIRLMLQFLGYRVTKLLRIRVGSVELDELPVGKWRELNSREVSLLEMNSAPETSNRNKSRRFKRPTKDRESGRSGPKKPRKGRTNQRPPR